MRHSKLPVAISARIVHSNDRRPRGRRLLTTRKWPGSSSSAPTSKKQILLFPTPTSSTGVNPPSQTKNIQHRTRHEPQSFADQLVKVQRKRGKELWLLVRRRSCRAAANEISRAKRSDTTCASAFDIFRRPATSLAILCDTNVSWRPEHYGFDYPDTSLSFRFGMVKLLASTICWTSTRSQRQPLRRRGDDPPQSPRNQKDKQSRKKSGGYVIRRLYETRDPIIS